MIQHLHRFCVSVWTRLSPHWFNWCECVSGGQTSVCLPEQTDDDGAGEQSYERQAVAQSGQYLHHPVKDQLHTHRKHMY